jgi:hypothetical protein
MVCSLAKGNLRFLKATLRLRTHTFIGLFNGDKENVSRSLMTSAKMAVETLAFLLLTL